MTSNVVDRVDGDGIEHDAFVMILLRDWLVSKVHRHTLFGWLNLERNRNQKIKIKIKMHIVVKKKWVG
jgi:hypothetical protein